MCAIEQGKGVEESYSALIWLMQELSELRNCHPSFQLKAAYPYKRDLQDVEFHLLDTGYFVLEEDGDAIANHIRQFFTSRLQASPLS